MLFFFLNFYIFKFNAIMLLIHLLFNSIIYLINYKQPNGYVIIP